MFRSRSAARLSRTVEVLVRGREIRAAAKRVGLALLVAGLLAASVPSKTGHDMTWGAPSIRAARATEVEVGLGIGQRAPDFTVTGLDGAPLTSAELLAQEKPFILYFFATW